MSKSIKPVHHYAFNCFEIAWTEGCINSTEMTSADEPEHTESIEI